MSGRGISRILLAAAGVYDGALGLAFLLAAPAVFDAGGIPAPTHWGYVHFGAALLVIFALMFFAAAMAPVRNRNLVPYGILLKIAYVGVVAFHWSHGGVPWIFAMFLFFDAVWIAVLAWVWRALGRAEPAAAEQPAA